MIEWVYTTKKRELVLFDTMAKKALILFRTKRAHQPRNEDFEFDGDMTTGAKRNDIESFEMYLSKKK